MSSDKVLDTLHRFITRDLVLIISGGTVVGTFLYLSGHLPAADDSWMLFALLAGLGYFIAYSIQEVLCILGLITTTAVSNPNRFVQWLYKRYDHRAWKPITFDSREARHQFTDDEQWAEFQRIVTLQMVGTAGGPSMVACGFMFMLKWWNYPDPFHLTVSVVGGLLGAMLICLSWLKGAQRAQFVATYGKRKLGRGQVLQRNMSPTRE